MKKIRFNKLFLLVLIIPLSACIWAGPGRDDHRHDDDRGDRHQEREHGDRDDHDHDDRNRFNSAQRGDDLDQHRYWL